MAPQYIIKLTDVVIGDRYRWVKAISPDGKDATATGNLWEAMVMTEEQVEACKAIYTIPITVLEVRYWGCEYSLGTDACDCCRPGNVIPPFILEKGYSEYVGRQRAKS